ncbi:unnamed protein product [Cylicostephanus goldi]|uniref:Uncharacterized protein n=1 Tax=Cylicostephanus goldi TaxID=71465 RepID=A0A3P7NL91_CYLGO|nr:unnamed protein product [Cylicostephanus goldi]
MLDNDFADELRRHPPASLLSQLPLDELNSWLTVSVEQPALDVNVCCQKLRQNRETIFFDPLGALTVSALSLLNPPTVNSARIPIPTTSYVNYHRQARTHIGESTEELFLQISGFVFRRFLIQSGARRKQFSDYSGKKRCRLAVSVD